MKKLLLITFLLLGGLEIASRIGIEPIEFYDVPIADGYVGFAFYPVIVYKNTKDVVVHNLNGESTQIHERMHHAQAERNGFMAYKLSYAYNAFTVGYDNNDFEIEAYAAEHVRPIKKRSNR